MKVTRVFAAAIASCSLLSIYAGAAHADAAAGKKKFNADCAGCHEAGDFEGEDIGALAATLRRFAAGQQKHKASVSLTDGEIADVATYLASGGK